MKIESEQLELYEGLSEKLRLFIVQNLKDCLKNVDISDSDKEEICGEFLAELYVNLDQGEWECKDKFYRPVIGFIGGKDLRAWGGDTTLIPPYRAYQHHDKVWEDIEGMYREPWG